MSDINVQHFHMNSSHTKYICTNNKNVKRQKSCAHFILHLHRYFGEREDAFMCNRQQTPMNIQSKHNNRLYYNSKPKY